MTDEPAREMDRDDITRRVWRELASCQAEHFDLHYTEVFVLASSSLAVLFAHQRGESVDREYVDARRMKLDRVFEEVLALPDPRRWRERPSQGRESFGGSPIAETVVRAIETAGAAEAAPPDEDRRAYDVAAERLENAQDALFNEAAKRETSSLVSATNAVLALIHAQRECAPCDASTLLRRALRVLGGEA